MTAWTDADRRSSVVLPTGSGKTFVGIQAIADTGLTTLVVVPRIDLLNQWHATLTNAFGDQLTEPIGVLGGGTHDIAPLTVTTYDSAYRYVNDYGDQFGLLVVDEVHHLPARLPTNPGDDDHPVPALVDRHVRAGRRPTPRSR